MTTWRDYGPPDLPAPLSAALEAFAESGYHGTTVRDIASRAGLSVPGLYHHYPSKQSLLQGLSELTMEELLGRSEAALAEAGAEPLARFDALVESLLRFHMYRRAQAFVGSTEVRSMDPEYRAVYIGHRTRQQRMVDDAVDDGVAAGIFTTEFPHDAARALSTMCVGVSTWYRPGGWQTPEQLVERNLVLARDLVGYSHG
ncbi:TetR/AcrR family transcriptional regulator [Gordonia alkaliphila]|uniref:TetR/AcrR family transcriptional regulator n=1 Tax=Gordonia alkaliphila TaxID=1053547 RepID=UPI001FF58611|nr:TetR/AcrR family transcriptional regulator [Gordonia alkaliphila]MCK0438882.1 TetR/AcrR family transcriptional regulator [Gordonia alkaliphila]